MAFMTAKVSIVWGRPVFFFLGWNEAKVGSIKRSEDGTVFL